MNSKLHTCPNICICRENSFSGGNSFTGLRKPSIEIEATFYIFQHGSYLCIGKFIRRNENSFAGGNLFAELRKPSIKIEATYMLKIHMLRRIHSPGCI